MRTCLTVATMLMVLCGELPAHAEIINSSFEAGNSGYWSSSGNAIVVSSAFGVHSPNGSYQALLTTASSFGDSNNFGGLDSVSDATLQSFLGVALDAMEGSAIAQTFTASAGDTLSFQFNFLSTDSFANDYAFVTLNGQLIRLADTNSPLSPSLVDLDPVFGDPTFETGYQTFTILLTTSGLYTLGFGVVDVTDEFGPSALLLDNIQLSSADATVVPEPSTFLAWVVVACCAFGARLCSRKRSLLMSGWRPMISPKGD